MHGFGATKICFSLLKKAIEVNFDVKVIISLDNIGRTTDSIEKQGERLAN